METVRLITVGNSSSARNTLFRLLVAGGKDEPLAGNIFTVSFDRIHQVVLKEINQFVHAADVIPSALTIGSFMKAKLKTAFLLAIDLKDESSAKDLEKWVKRLREASKTAPIILVGVTSPGKPRELGLLDLPDLALKHDCHSFVELVDDKPQVATCLLEKTAQYLYLDKPEPGYEKIWSEAPTGFLNKARALLKDYALKNKQWKGFFHPRRHFSQEVIKTLEKMDDIDFWPKKILYLLQNLKATCASFPYGSLARRIAFIERKLKAIYIMPYEHDSLIFANSHKVKLHPLTRHMHDQSFYTFKLPMS